MMTVRPAGAAAGMQHGDAGKAMSGMSHGEGQMSHMSMAPGAGKPLRPPLPVMTVLSFVALAAGLALALRP